MKNAPALTNVAIIVVDDWDDIRDFTTTVLERHGALVRGAASAEEGLALLDVALPDVIVSDIAMPTMDGYEFLRAVRKLSPERGGTLPAIALSSFTTANDQKRSFESGFQAHLAKPCSGDLLVATIRDVLVAGPLSKGEPIDSGLAP